MPLGHFDRSSRSDPPMARPRSGRWGHVPDTDRRAIACWPWVTIPSSLEKISASLENLRIPRVAAKFQLESLILAQNER